MMKKVIKLKHLMYVHNTFIFNFQVIEEEEGKKNSKIKS